MPPEDRSYSAMTRFLILPVMADGFVNGAEARKAPAVKEAIRKQTALCKQCTVFSASGNFRAVWPVAFFRLFSPFLLRHSCFF